MQCWDAKHLAHLALPRAVGPYTTIRATRRISLNTVSNVIGTFQTGSGVHASATNDWNGTVLITDVSATNPISAGTNAHAFSMPLDGLGEAATLVPSALTVQVMCPTSLQTASGIIYAGVMNTQAAIGGRSETWESYMEKFVQFQNPRLLAASKLALRGVQINSYPLNMTEVSRFTPLIHEGDGTFTYSTSSPEPVGWAPIIIYNPNSVDLELHDRDWETY